MERIASEELQRLRDEGVEIFSISRLDTINGCAAEAHKTYHLKQKGEDNIYSVMGSKIHDTLEAIINGEATEKDLLPAMKSELETADMLGIEFAKDRNGQDSIRDGWIADMTHFCETFKTPDKKKRNKMVTESEFVYKTDEGKYLVGYIDVYVKGDGKHIRILDYKTSSLYDKEGFKEHNRQLLIYMLGMQQQGYIVDQTAWDFLKYVTVTYQGYKTARSKERTEIVKNIERRKIGETLAPAIERDMKEAGYSEIDIEFAIDKIKKFNRLDIILPKEIADNYKIKHCIVEGDISEEAIAECKEYIRATIEKWEDMETFPPRDFYKWNKDHTKKSPDVFYCNFLCNHRNTCDYIKEFNEQQESLRQGQEDEDDLF